MRTLRLSSVVLSLSLASCSNNAVTPGTDAAITADAGGDDSSTVDGGGGVDAGGTACDPVMPLCIDESISQLDLFDTISPALIIEEGTTAGEFLSHVDATGGGFMPTQAFVYARFTETGLEKVEITDEDALASTDWDVAFRRFIIRLNSGISGPSCVTGARTAGGTTFDGLTAVPDGLAYRTEEYFTETCELVPDGSGLGSPATALASYWMYPGCVEMTDNVYVIETAAGRHVKLQVMGYYPLDIQEMCDTAGTVPTPSGGGNMRVRWAFLD